MTEYSGYYFIIQEPYEFYLAGVRYWLKANERYETNGVKAEVLADGVIEFYYTISYEGVEISVKEDIGVVVHSDHLQQDKTMLDKYLRETGNDIESYRDAYRDHLDLEINPYADIDPRYFYEPT